MIFLQFLFGGGLCNVSVVVSISKIVFLGLHPRSSPSCSQETLCKQTVWVKEAIL